MSSWQTRTGLNLFAPDRRRFPRQAVTSLAYADVGGGKGGIVLNMSENGLAIHSAVALSPRPISSVRFQLPDSFAWVTAQGRIMWTSESKKEAGIELFAVPEPARTEIRKWIASQSYTDNRPPVESQRPDLPETTPVLPSGEVSATEALPEIGPMENEGLDRALRSHFAERDRQKSGAGVHVWWGLIALVLALAVVSFSLGWVTGRDNWDGLVSAFAKVRGRLASVTQTGPAIANASASAAPAAPQGLALVPHFTVASTFYVPVAAPSAHGTSNRKSIQLGRLERRADPLYPADALTHDVEGTVHLRASVGEDGAIHEVSVVSGPPLLTPSAENAVRSWRYSPTLLDGKPVATQEDISLVFSLAPAAPPHHHP
jgi:TonB family protein